LLWGREDSVQRGQRPQDGLLWLTPADSRPRLAWRPTTDDWPCVFFFASSRLRVRPAAWRT